MIILPYLTVFILLFSKASGQCQAVSCSSTSDSQPESGNERRNRVCSETNTTHITIHSQMCGDGEECFTNENWYGTCEPAVTPNFDYILYPGYRCRGDEVYGVCRFGTKVCNAENRCEGFPAYSQCKRSSDCNFGLYCSNEGICLELNAAGEQCTTHDSCEKNYMCLYLTPTQTFGTCVEAVSKDERELVLPEYNDLPVRQEDMEKLCRGGMVNRTTGRCATKLTSTNKGKVCTTDADCPTSDDNVNAQCRCGFNTNGDKYCDIEAGDDEWLEATRLFQDFYLLNLDCHTGEGFGECGNDESMYKTYKCAEFKAKNYVELLNNPECLQATYKNNPFFWEYAYYCKACNLISSLKILIGMALIWSMV